MKRISVTQATEYARRLDYHQIVSFCMDENTDDYLNFLLSRKTLTKRGQEQLDKLLARHTEQRKEVEA